MTSKTIVIDKLEGADNYTTWSIRVKAYLTKLGYKETIKSEENSDKN
jgi:hypothetical protein